MSGRLDFHKVIIGRSEKVTFTDLGIENIPAKTDTGAYCSAIHASNIHLDKTKSVLSFVLLGEHHLFSDKAVKVETTQFGRVKIVNSFGQTEERYEVKLRIKLGPKVFMAPFSLADRSTKIFPILLGRKSLNNRFVVDPAYSAIDKRSFGGHEVMLQVDEEAQES
jgi:hypothetical protein